ncbi:hypothetical protein U9M48_019804 [Paspalum notatum var. saurae]|uniref:Reverse transcriptase Ty1/copia-type domain-containing protein n=1 Tax=Paspalum notatum var. saurae TaxID=547442 RepID=A0AAQ3WR15_PASNO
METGALHKLIDLRFKPSKSDTSLFIFQECGVTIYMLIYVDDIIVTSSSEKDIEALLNDLRKNFALKDLGDLHYFLGIEVKRNKDELLLFQKNYQGMKENLLMKNATLYHALTDIHWTAVKRIIKYIKYTIDLGLRIQKSDSTLLSICSDVDCLRSIYNRKSIGGFPEYCDPNLVFWSSRKQPMESRSSTEAQNKSTANATTETIWLESHLFVGKSCVPYRAKYIEIDFHFVRNRFINKQLQVRLISVKDQVADGFTKALSAKKL